MARELIVQQPRVKTGVTFELNGAPPWVEAAFKRRATLERVQLSRRRPIVNVPERREPVAPVMRAREQGAGRRRTAARASPDDPSPPEPEPVEVWRGLVVASTKMIQRCERRRAKLAAP
jgi:hypothetical protein